jgi:Flp pilus assembly protein TadG
VVFHGFGDKLIQSLTPPKVEKNSFSPIGMPSELKSTGAGIRGCTADLKLDRDNVKAKRRGGKSTAGTSILEIALIAPMFLLLLFGTVDFAHLFWVELTLQNAIRQAGRYAITGNHLPDPNHSGQNLTRVASIVQVAQQTAVGLDVSNIQISSLTGGTGSAGGPGDTVTIALTTNMPLITPIVGKWFRNGVYTFTVSVTMKNEPFPPSDTG